MKTFCFAEECRIPLEMQPAVKHCGYWYHLNSKWTDHSAYNVGWNANLTSTNRQLTVLEKAYRYQTSAELRSAPFWGYLTTYEGGGYVANLGQNLTFAKTMMSDLSKNSWVDRFTRAIILEFNVLNIQSGLFTQVFLSTEFPPVGGAYYWLDLTSVQLYRYAGALGLLNIFTELTCLLACLIFAGFTIKDFIKTKCAFLKTLQGITQLLVVICFIIAMSLYAYRSVWTVRQVEYMMHHWGMSFNSEITNHILPF